VSGNGNGGRAVVGTILALLSVIGGLYMGWLKTEQDRIRDWQEPFDKEAIRQHADIRARVIALERENGWTVPEEGGK